MNLAIAALMGFFALAVAVQLAVQSLLERLVEQFTASQPAFDLSWHAETGDTE
jgi:hypothetical protein